MKDKVIVARYKEDLNWLSLIPESFDVTIYNKGEEITSRKALSRNPTIIALPNNGRESDTYIRHILRREYEPESYTVFLQGDPFEHSPDIIGLLAACQQWKDLQALSWRWRPSAIIPPPELLADETGAFIAGFRLRPELFSLFTWNQLQFFDPGARKIDAEYRASHNLSPAKGIASDFLQRCGMSELADCADKTTVGTFSYGALFAVKGYRLSQIPSESLELLLKAANSHHVYGYIIERLWLHLCGEPFLLTRVGSNDASNPALISETGSFVSEPAKLRPHQRLISRLQRRFNAIH